MRRSRSDLVQEFLERNGLRGWLSWRPDELVLLAGHQPHWGLSVLLLLRDGETILFTLEGEPPVKTESLTVLRYPWGDMRVSDPFAVLSRMLAEELRTRGISAGEIGFQPRGTCYAPSEVAAEQGSFPADALGLLSEGMRSDVALNRSFLDLHLVKSPEELRRIALANEVANCGLDVFEKSVLVGASEVEIAADVERAIARTTGTSDIHSARAWAMVQAGANTADAGSYSRSSGYRVANGDVVLIELATCVNGYWSDRTLTAGSPLLRASRVLQAIAEAQQAAMSVARDGVTAEAVDHSARKALQQAGLSNYFTHALGHHVGFRYHDPGFALAPGSKEVLRSGMVLTIDPGVYLPNEAFGVRLEYNIATTETGCRC